jgi:peptidoglycan/xylan/chitin deacetylase (PgdA/CDA1 family)
VKPPASLSLDLDNEWSYLKTRGDSAWESYPSYLDVVVPRVLRLLDELGLRITFFIVGQDAALEQNREAMAALGRSGHEIGCHSLRHEPWLHLYAEDEIEHELASAEEHIEAATGHRPRGFRGPGFSLSEATLRVLERRGYRYDATTFRGPARSGLLLPDGAPRR